MSGRPDAPALDPVVARVRELLARRLAIEVPSPRSDLFAEGLLDSFALVELTVELEAEFDVRLKAFDIESFRTLRHIAGWIVESGSPT